MPLVYVGSRVVNTAGFPRSYPVNIAPRTEAPAVPLYIEIKCKSCDKLLSVRRDAAGIVCSCDVFNSLKKR